MGSELNCGTCGTVNEVMPNQNWKGRQLVNNFEVRKTEQASKTLFVV
jgi:hypothetical protein